MKTSITRFLMASSAALGIASLAHAQPSAGPAERPGAHRVAMDGHGHGGMHGPRHGMRGMFRQLNLSEAQQDQIFKIHHDQAPAFREQAKKVRAAREALHRLAAADRLDDGAVRRAADAQAKAMSDLAVMHVQTLNRVRGVLTPEQRTQFDKLREQRRGRGPRA